jgi:hypothetical protein
MIYEEALFIGQSERYAKIKKKLWRRATLPIGTPLGNLQQEQGSLTGGLERQ